jgi:plastocyanin
MNRYVLLIALALALSANAFAAGPFTLVSSEKRTVKESDIATLQKEQTPGKVTNLNLEFTASEVRLVVVAGPEDDMYSYRIAGIRNPNLLVPAGATLKVLFVNTDADMNHDIRFGNVSIDFPQLPATTDTVGTTRLGPEADDATMQAEEVTIKATDTGAFKYFCSVRGHAKGGMWGNILVGVKPDANLKIAPKSKSMPDMKEMPKKPGMNGMNMPGTTQQMRSSINVGEPMSREGSGTSWVPDSSPIYAQMKAFADGGTLMIHGTAFVRYTSVGSGRDISIAGRGSSSRVDAPSMLMLMYSRPAGEKSQFAVRTMFSLDPLIERGWGYPLLFQSGETYRGEPIHDRQHPHDFISELAATYSHEFGGKSSIYFYAGYPGEPALGPVMYLHRQSAANIPDAPIGHHWQDATHISFGVATVGYTYDKIKFEASSFNGSDPDENRWAFDPPRLNSFSARVSFNPTREWSFQVSHGYLKDPERAEPDIRIMRRTTASAMYNRSFDENHNLASTFVWGQNYANTNRTNAFLFESNFEFFRNSIFGRAEQVQKDGDELALPLPHPDGNFWMQAYSIGYLRDVVKNKAVDLGLGSMITFDFNPSALASFYSGTNHTGWQIFFRIRASKQ